MRAGSLAAVRLRVWGTLALAGLLAASAARAQELEPRAYAPAPAGANFFLVG